MQFRFTLNAPKSLSWLLDFRNNLPSILTGECPNSQNLPSPGLGLSADLEVFFGRQILWIAANVLDK
jgi:hypothetical protein